MKNTKKIAAIAAIAMLGIGGLATATQTNPTVVQAATKKKSRQRSYTKYKRVHCLIVNSAIGLSEETICKNSVPSPSSGDYLIAPYYADGYKYINGTKYLHTLKSNKEKDQFVPARAMEKPTIYHATSTVKLAAAYFSEGNDGHHSNDYIIHHPDVNDYPHTAQGFDEISNKAYMTAWVKPGTGKNNTIAIFTNKVFTFYGEKYYAASPVTSNVIRYIKVSDMNKVAKGGIVKGTDFDHKTDAQLKKLDILDNATRYLKGYGYDINKVIYGNSHISMK